MRPTSTRRAAKLACAAALGTIATLGCSAEIDWSSKAAWRNCASAVAAAPDRPAPPCSALHMCANEAPLTPLEQAKLLSMIRATPGCAEP